MTVAVVVADDEPVVCAGIALLLASSPEIEVVAEVHDGSEAVEAYRVQRPDVVVMDVRMPVIDGVAATEHISDLARQAESEWTPPSPVLLLTTYNVDDAVFAGLRAGAAGFLLKDSAPAALIDAVRAVARGDGWLDPSVIPSLIREFAASVDDSTVDPGDRVASLTPREVDVLTHLARGLSNAEIAVRLFIGEGTVKTHVSHILVKLNLRDRSQAVAAAFHSGLVPPRRPRS